jgi:excisionase family DNA binding protein
MTTNLLPEHLNDLKKSGLNDQTIKRMGVYTVPLSEFFTCELVDEAAKLLTIKRNTLYTWACRRQIRSQKVGKALGFKRLDLVASLELQARTAILGAGK